MNNTIQTLPLISPERKTAETQIKQLLPRFTSAYSLGPRHMILAQYDIDLRDYYEQHKSELYDIIKTHGLELEEITAVFEKNVGTEVTIRFKLVA